MDGPTVALDTSRQSLPTGTVTFLLTDVEGSTRLWERYRDGMRAALLRHDELVERLVAEHGGTVVRPRGEGDSRFAVFPQASAACVAASAIQIALQAEPWPMPEPVRVRMALHTGEADVRDGDYYGSAVNRCARLRALARGGQVLLSGTTAAVVRDQGSADLTVKSLGTQQLKDLAEPEQVFQLMHPQLPASFPPLHSQDQSEATRAGERRLGQPGLPAIGTPAERRARARMLQKVQLDWIRGVLEPSLREVTPLRLGLDSRPDLVDPPLARVARQPWRAPEPLPPDTSIESVFDSVGGALVILGAPGAGKTTLLLQLAAMLLDRAAQDGEHPIPVVFVLSSWANHPRPLEAWLVDELAEQYYVPRKLAEAWVQAEMILPLLDSLDEVAPHQRNACLEAIIGFRQRHGLLPLVVCSRTADYEELDRHLPLPLAVQLQPPTRQQAETYLCEAAPGLVTRSAAMLDDESFADLLRTPLMLSIVTAVHQANSLDDVPQAGTPEEQRGALMRAYVRAMLARRGVMGRYTHAQTLRWLAWLARSMKHHRLGVFQVEAMQPSWLCDRWQHNLVTCGPAAMLALVLGLLQLVVGVVTTPQLPLGTLCVAALGMGALTGILAYGKDIRPVEVLHWSWWSHGSDGSLGAAARRLVSELMWIRRRGMLFALGAGLALGLSFGAAQYWGGPEVGTPQHRWTVFWLLVPSNVLDAWLLYGVYRALRGGVTGAFPGMIVGAVSGFVVTIAESLFDVVPSILVILPRVPPWQLVALALLHIAASSGLRTTLLYGFVGGLMGGLRRGELTSRTRPNEGLRRSARSAMVSALFVGVAFTATVVLLQHAHSQIDVVSGFGPSQTEVSFPSLLVGAVMFGVIVALPFGARACLQHLILRTLLWRAGCLPWRYSCFLDYAAERILLHRVGGGYIFVHPMLLEHFANSGRESVSSLLKTHQSPR